MCWSPCWSQGHHRTFVSLPSPGKLTQEWLQRPAMLRSLSLLRLTCAVCFESSSFLPKIALCSQHQFSSWTHSLPSLPPQRARHPAHRSPPQLHYSTPVPHTIAFHPFPMWALQIHGTLWASCRAEKARGRGDDMTTGWAHCRAQTALFPACSEWLSPPLPLPWPLRKEFMSRWRKVSPSSFCISPL